ncbi:MAG: tRNA pseudouridine(55) synthase TruB [Candidatus Cloacimonadaceae bacterium]|nr:tRNA pseudouridine(55) synthase TruB [Candidatus Cloacimonadaceae bacterium]
MADKGFLLIDKPEGITSFNVIRILRKITSLRRIGHCGTLDPFATGLLICTLGNYTRLSQFIEAQSKQYTARIVLGEKTDTGDKTGTVIETKAIEAPLADPDEIRAAALALTELPVPAYSAIKIDGVRSYKLARQGIAQEIPARPTKISEFDILELDLPYVTYSCTVSKGTYIRSLSEWLAERFGSVGHTVELRRTAIGDIKLDAAHSLEDLSAGNWQDKLLPAWDALSSLERVFFIEAQITELMQGKIIPFPGEDNDTVMIFDATQTLKSVCARKDSLLKPRINLP